LTGLFDNLFSLGQDTLDARHALLDLDEAMRMRKCVALFGDLGL
jgi:hypothetical protein